MNVVNLNIVLVLLVAAVLAPAQIRVQSAEPRKEVKSGQDSASQNDGRQSLSGPILGYVAFEVPDSAGTEKSCSEHRVFPAPIKAPCRKSLQVHAILGVPEASYFSDPIELPEFANRIVFAPGHTWAIVFRGNGTSALAWSPENGTLGTFEGVERQPDLLAFSPSGGEVGFYWGDAKRLVLYSLLPQGISILQTALPQPLSDDLVRLAVADGGAGVAGLTSSGNVFLISTLSPLPLPLYDSQGRTDFAFRLNSADLIVSDHVAEKVMVFEQLAGSYGSRTLLTTNDGLIAPDFVSPVENGTVLVSSRAANRVWSVDPATRVVSTSDATVTQPFAKLRLSGSFLTSSESGQPGWIYQSTAGGPRVTFVPAFQGTGQQQRE